MERPGEELKTMRLPGFLNLLMSEMNRFDRPTPTSGPGALLLTPGGKCCWMMKPAVREENAFLFLLKNAAVPALDTAVASSSLPAAPPRTTQTASTLPSRSVTAMTLFGEMFTARVTA